MLPYRLPPDQIQAQSTFINGLLHAIELITTSPLSLSSGLICFDRTPGHGETSDSSETGKTL
jgi:hypothetical protein